MVVLIPVFPAFYFLQMPLDWNSHWIPKYVLVSDFRHNGTNLHRLFSHFKHFQLLIELTKEGPQATYIHASYAVNCNV